VYWLYIQFHTLLNGLEVFDLRLNCHTVRLQMENTNCRVFCKTYELGVRELRNGGLVTINQSLKARPGECVGQNIAIEIDAL
jgi:hypothetical protein